MKRIDFVVAASGAIALAALPIMASAAQRLRMFHDDYEWYAAYDYEDLKAVIRDLRAEDYDPRDYGGDSIEQSFRESLPSNTSRVWIDDGGHVAEQGFGSLVSKTNAEWVAQLGRGFLWATEG